MMPSHVEEAAALLNKNEHKNSAQDVVIPMPELSAQGTSTHHGDTAESNKRKSTSSSKSSICAEESGAEQVLLRVPIKKEGSQHNEFQPNEVLLEPVLLVDNEINRLNSQLLDAIINQNNVEVERLLNEGASPNATCRAKKISACHVAAYTNSDALKLLLIKDNAIKDRKNSEGSTPLHFAALAGNNQNIATLLNLPFDIENNEDLKTMKERTYLFPVMSSSIIDVPCRNILIPELEESWRDSQDHNCEGFMASVVGIKSGWTPLHIASFAGHNKSTRLLLAAGANPNIYDLLGDTPLAIAGDMFNLDTDKFDINSYVETIKTLLEYRRIKCNTQDSCPRELGTALLTAVKLCCEEAVQLLLKAGAPVTQPDRLGNTSPDECFKTSNENLVQARVGYTAIHLAARKGNLVILNLILEAVQNTDDVNYGNDNLETPLICAIRSGNLDCVKALINKGASLHCNPTLGHKLSDEEKYEIYSFLMNSELERDFDEEVLPNTNKKTNPSWDTVCTGVINNNLIFHAVWMQTTENEYIDIVEYILDCENSLEDLLDYRCPEIKYMIPLEVAAFERKSLIFEFLMRKSIERAKAREKDIDPIILWLYIRAIIIYSKVNNTKLYDIYDILRITINLFPDALQIMPRLNIYIFHAVIKHNHKEMILFLLRKWADLCVRDHKGRTAISLLISLSNSVKFLESVFDDCMSTINNFGDYEELFITNVRFDFGVLAPSLDSQMKVLKALVDTGNYKGQKELLMHPLVESFLYLKWQACSNYFCLVIFLYVFFALSLSVLIGSDFYFKDHKEPLPNFCHPLIWSCITYVSVTIIVSQELSHIHFTSISFKNCPSRETITECLVKYGSLALAIVTPIIITKECDKNEWWRYMAAVTLVLAWSNIMILLSKTPPAGYYMQMFGSVSLKVLKILLTFLALIIMFSLCFMVLFHTQVPFDGPVSAFIKTLVMMTSEFEYKDTFSKVSSDVATVVTIRFIFVVFLIVTAIALMNLMIGVAVSDANELIYKGQLRRLEMQVEFLYAIELSRQNKSVFHILSLHNLFKSDKIPRVHVFYNYEHSFTAHISRGIKNKDHEKTKQKRMKLEAFGQELKFEDKLQKHFLNYNKQIIEHYELKLDKVLHSMANIEKMQVAHGEILQRISKYEENIKNNEFKLDGIVRYLRKLDQTLTETITSNQALNKQASLDEINDETSVTLFDSASRGGS